MAGLAEQVRRFLFQIRTAHAGGSGRKRVKTRGRRPSNGLHWAEQDTGTFKEDETPASSDLKSSRTRSAAVLPYYVWGTLALLMTGAAIGAVFWQLSSAKRIETVEQKPEAPDPMLPLQDRAKAELLKPVPELSAELKRVFSGVPDTLCKELQALGLENPGWRKAPFQRNRWQCASELVQLTTPSVDFGAATLFFLLRGPSEDKIDYLRLKLVVEDKRQKQIGLEAVWLVIDSLAERYGWTVPEGFRNAIMNFRKLETTHRGVQLSVAPEDPKLTGDPLAGQRLNIILNFGEPDLIRPADRFEKAPPLESGWTATGATGRAGE